MSRYILSAVLLFVFIDAYSQVPDTIAWGRIDSMITAKKDLSVVFDQVQQLRRNALAGKKYLTVARCYYYEMLVTDLRSEDSSYFRNAAFMDSLLMTQTDKKELQWIMHVLLAKRLMGFTTRYQRFNRRQYERNDIPVNYAAFSNKELDSLAQYHFEQAKTIVKSIANSGVPDALWLSSDPLLFLFKPGLYDIVIAEQISNLKKKYYYSYYPWKGIQVMQLSPDEFIEKIDTLYATDRENLKQLRCYKEWMGYHRLEPASYYFIETLARKFTHEIMNSQYNPGTITDGYDAYLQRIVLSPYGTVKAHGVYQLCLFWNQQSKQYFPKEEYGYRFTYLQRNDYDTTMRYQAVKALQLFEQNKTMLDSFGYLKNILLRVEQQILETEINISMEEYSLPGEPILAELSYKNADKLYYSIVHMTVNDVFTFRTRKELIGHIRQFPEVLNNVTDLPFTDDHNKHGVYLKLDALSAGRYAILFSDQPLTDSNKKIERLYFKVSSIAVVNSNRRVFVLDRKTGMPVAGAIVEGYYKQDGIDTSKRKQAVTKEYTTNARGFAIINDKMIGVNVYYKSDTLYPRLEFRDIEDDRPEDVYTKDEYDNLAEFYEENANTYIFTDRSIYRPGQTVYFKAIFLTKDKNTGERIVMSKKNMGRLLFKNVYKKWLKDSEPLLYFTDPFDREVDSIKIKPNEFGSLSGSFIIPKTAATGDWSIEPDYIENERNTGLFRVEEYKRPSYEVSIETPKKQLLPVDTFSVKVKVKSFAGASLNNVLINYNVARRGEVPADDTTGGKPLTKNSDEDIIDTLGYTNAEGELEIKVNDTLLSKYLLAKDTRWDFTYAIEAEAVDVTGENYETRSSIDVSSRPVSIAMPFAANFNRSEKNSVLITASDKNAGKVAKDIGIKIYRIEKEEKIYSSRKLVKADQWIYHKEQLQQWFPFINILNHGDTGTKNLVYETTIHTGNGEKLNIDPAVFIAGNYLAEAVCDEKGKRLGENEKYFSVFDEKEKKLPGAKNEFYHLKVNGLFPNDTVKFYNGNSTSPVYAIYHISWYGGKNKVLLNHDYEIRQQEPGLEVFRWKVPSDAVDQGIISQLYILNNEVFSRDEKIYINGKTVAEPEIIVEQYRKKLSPGSKETFSVTIKTKNENTAAELMTTMYDASLDKLEPHRWELPRDRTGRYLRTYSEKEINSVTRNMDFFPNEHNEEDENSREHDVDALWWLSPLSFGYKEEDEEELGERRWSFQHDLNPNIRWSGWAGNYNGDVAVGLMGKASGLTIANTDGLQEVVVIGYSSVKVSAKSISGSVIQIRGATSLTNYNQPLIIIDGIPYTGDLSKLDPNTITQAIVLKGSDAGAIYGAMAARGVLVLSTKGDIVFPSLPPEPPLPPRKNFNETAFFFPNVYADKDGYYKFNFTMPESVTEWNWKILAHTKKAQFIYAERKLNTQLPLMVQPNMPRLLYQGDRIVLQSRISNLDTTDATGKAICKIEDVVTGEDVTSAWVAKTGNDFSVTKRANISSAFEIKVPKTQLNPVKIIISVRSANFSDGEEHIIPVLSPKMLIRQTVPFRFSANADTTIGAATLTVDAELYGVGVSILPKPQSALLNALPWLANYSYDCAEQTFNKLLAHVTALKIMRTDKQGQQSFDKAKEIIEKQPATREQLPDELSEQAMPWLNAGNKTLTLQKQLFELLDTSRTELQISKHLQKLYKLQNYDGGLTWFEGGKSNEYISNYVLAGFGKLSKDHLLIPERMFDQKYVDFIAKLLGYCQNNFENTAQEKITFYDPLTYAYARSFWKEKYPFTDSLLQNIQVLIKKRWKKVANNSLYGQATLIITTLRYFDKTAPEFQQAIEQLNSIEQLSIRDNVNGVRWKDLADNDDMSNATEEILALLADAFAEAGIHPELPKGIVKWLLTAKNEDHWSSTKATSAVIGMLSNENNTATGVTQTLTSKINNQELTVTNDLLSGSSFSFVKTGNSLPVSIKKQADIPATGSLVWYYFSAGGYANNVNKQVNLKKEIARYNTASGKWEAIDDKTTLHIADKIKVQLTIETAKALRYVYVDDKRAAAFEPKENHSGYQYGDGISYYQSVRDAGMQFFTDFIPSGRTTIGYEMIVAQEGNFTNGPASLQCMYKPDVNAYSGSMTVQTIK